MRFSGVKFQAKYCSCEGDTTKIDVTISIEVKVKHIARTDTGVVTLAETHNLEKEVSTETVTSSSRKSIKELDSVWVSEKGKKNKLKKKRNKKFFMVDGIVDYVVGHLKKLKEKS